MPPASKRKGEKPKPKGDASDATTDDVRGPPPLVPPKVRHTESEASSTEMEEMSEGKRFKPGSPTAKRAAAASASPAARSAAAAVNAAVATAPSDGKSTSPGKARRRKRTPAVELGASSVGVDDLKVITTGLTELLLADGVSPALAKKVLQYSSQYESLLMRLMMENERLRGRLDVVSRPADAGLMPPPSMPAPRALGRAPAAAVPALPKPVETWSVVVRGKGASSKEVIKKVEKEVGSTLGVRVHQLLPLRDGGAIIRTPSVAESEKVARNAKFGEVGLEVSVRDKLGPKVVVQRVHPEITPDEFMTEMYEMNLKKKMSLES